MNNKTALENLEIPKDYEIDYDTLNKVGGCGNLDNFFIPLKKKQIKDFEWYMNEYIKITTYIEPHAKKNMLAGEWSVVEFELRIGLLKFICDDIGVSWKNVISKGLDALLHIEEIEKVAPLNFLRSILS